MSEQNARQLAEHALLDAAEELLISKGYAEISTRRLAETAGITHGMVHYYFGSMEHLFLRVLERFTDRLIERQKALYLTDIPFIDKWRTAMGFLEDDHQSGYQKIWLELQAMAWNHPELREQMGSILGRWRAVLMEAFTTGLKEFSIDTGEFPVEALVTLVITFNEGIILERMSGITTGQAALLRMIDQFLARLKKSTDHREESNDASE
jgi:AcrR family transcriptional regulator